MANPEVMLQMISTVSSIVRVNYATQSATYRVVCALVLKQTLMCTIMEKKEALNENLNQGHHFSRCGDHTSNKSEPSNLVKALQ